MKIKGLIASLLFGVLASSSAKSDWTESQLAALNRPGTRVAINNLIQNTPAGQTLEAYLTSLVTTTGAAGLGNGAVGGLAASTDPNTVVSNLKTATGGAGADLTLRLAALFTLAGDGANGAVAASTVLNTIITQLNTYAGGAGATTTLKLTGLGALLGDGAVSGGAAATVLNTIITQLQAGVSPNAGTLTARINAINATEFGVAANSIQVNIAAFKTALAARFAAAGGGTQFAALAAGTYGAGPGGINWTNAANFTMAQLNANLAALLP